MEIPGLSHVRRATIVLCALLVQAPAWNAPPLHAEVAPTYLGQWGTYGTAPGSFNEAYAIALTPDGHVLTGEYTGHRLQKFTPTGELETVLDNGVYVTGMAVDASGYLYVVDQPRARILKYSPALSLVAEWGSRGTADGQFSSPFGVGVDRLGHVFVTDWDLERVSKFTSDGVFLGKWGSFGDANGQFKFMNGIACDPDGNVFVVDRINYRIQKFTNDGVFVRAWGSQGSGEGQFVNVIGISIDQVGNVYTSDTAGPGISKFTGDGIFLMRWGARGSGPGALSEPRGVAVGADGTVFAMDRYLGAVFKYGYLPTPATPASWGRIKALYRQ